MIFLNLFIFLFWKEIPTISTILRLIGVHDDHFSTCKKRWVLDMRTRGHEMTRSLENLDNLRFNDQVGWSTRGQPTCQPLIRTSLIRKSLVQFRRLLSLPHHLKLPSAKFLPLSVRLSLFFYEFFNLINTMSQSLLYCAQVIFFSLPNIMSDRLKEKKTI